MKKKKLFCLIFFCFVVIPVFCKNQFTVNKSFSIQQVEPKEKDIEVRTQKFSFSIKKVRGCPKRNGAALIILNLQENSNLLKFKYEQRRKR